MILRIDNKFYSMATKIIIWPPGSGSVIQDYETADPDPEEIFAKNNLQTFYFCRTFSWRTVGPSSATSDL